MLFLFFLLGQTALYFSNISASHFYGIWYLTHLVQYGITVSEEYFEEATAHRLETEVSRHSDLTNPVTAKHCSLICMLRVVGLLANDYINFMPNELYQEYIRDKSVQPRTSRV